MLCPEVPISISPLLRSSIVAILGAIGSPLERYIGMVVKLSVARSYICSPFKDPMKKRPFLSSYNVRTYRFKPSSVAIHIMPSRS